MSFRPFQAFRGFGGGGALSFDADAAAYFARIVAAGSTISEANKTAVNAFVVGCKADGIWSAIKASCILAGADTLAGALVPLVGGAPTNPNFVAGDYSRTTGLKGDGTSKYLNSNRNNNLDPQNSRHLSAWITGADTMPSGAGVVGVIGMNSSPSSQISYNRAVGEYFVRLSSSAFVAATTSRATGFHAISRAASGSVTLVIPGISSPQSMASATPASGNIEVFRRDSGSFWNGRISYYSIGESLNLALLDGRLTTLMAALT